MTKKVERCPTSGLGEYATTENIKILAPLVDFLEYPHTNTIISISSKLYSSGSGGYPYESHHNYYVDILRGNQDNGQGLL
jgi:hypothetical protein